MKKNKFYLFLALTLILSFSTYGQFHIGTTSSQQGGGVVGGGLNKLKYSENIYDASAVIGTGTYKSIRFYNDAFMIVAESNLYEYSMSGNDVTTLTYTGNSSSLGSTTSGIGFSDDGLKVITSNLYNLNHKSTTLSTAWLPSSLGSWIQGASSYANIDMQTKLDGTKGWVLESDNKKIYQYSYLTEWDATTISSDAVSLDFSNETSETGAYCFGFSKDGYQLALVGSDSNYIYEYKLTTPYDLTDGYTFIQKYDNAPDFNNIASSLTYSTDGTKIFILLDDGIILEYNTSIGAFDNDYQAILDKADALSYTKPSLSQQIIQNQLVLDLKSNGIWDKTDVLYVPANDGSKEFGYLNWITPASHELTKSGTVTWTSNVGFKGDGTTSYINTNWNPTDDGNYFTQTESSMFLYTATNDTKSGWRVLVGSESAVSLNSKIMLYRNNDNLGFYINRNTYTESSESTNLGLVHINRASNGDIKLFMDGTERSGQGLSPLSLSSDDIYIGGFNNNGTFGNASDVEWGVVGFGGDLEAEASILSTLTNDYVSDINIPLDNLISYYPLDANANDSKGTNDGTTNNVTYDTGKMGDAQHTADATSAGATIPSSTDFTFGNGVTDEPFSVSFYVNWDALNTSTDGWLVAKRKANLINEEWQVGVYNGMLWLALFSESNSTNQIYREYNVGANLSASTWYHVIVTYDGSGTKEGINIYIDNGLTLGTAYEIGTYVAMEETTSDVSIGWANYNASFSLDGLIDGVAIWNKELSASERTEIYKKQSGGNELID